MFLRYLRLFHERTLASVLFLLPTVFGNATENRPAIIPAPRALELRPGRFALSAATRVVAGPDAAGVAGPLAESLRFATGFKLPVQEAAGSTADAAIRLEMLPSLKSKLGVEGYQLTVAPTGVVLRAAAETGLFYGGVTLRQLLPPEVFAVNPNHTNAASPAVEWSLPCVEIEDAPRFAWRGLLLDAARHYLPPEFIKKMVDLAALHKLNRLQLHLTDDQGWRVEIRKYPKLTEIGSVRKESPLKGNRERGDGKPYGPYFYTQAELRGLVAYAQARHVTMVPEIEMPGHLLAALTAYPQFSCRGGPFQVRTRWGIEPDILCVGNEQAILFAQDILSEVIEIFPSAFIHIGGDEAPRERWQQCPKCQARMKAEGFKAPAQLQTYLNHRIEQFLAARGRRLIGWDEILEGGLTPGAAVMSWRGMDGGIAAARAGHDVVMSPVTHCYLDFAQARGANEPECIGGLIRLEHLYVYEPVPPELPPERRQHILGAQGNLWTEYMWTPEEVEYFAFPRAAALAEVVWSPQGRRDFGDFRRRIEAHCQRLDQLKVNYRRLKN